MRHRIEDLGRIQVMIEKLLEDSVFENNKLGGFRMKDYPDWYECKTEDEILDAIGIWVYGIDRIRDDLYEILTIAQGQDLFNEEPHHD